MCTQTETEEELTNVLENVADRLNWKSYSLNLNLTAEKGDGFLGEFFKVSITNKATNSTVHLAVKRAVKDPKLRGESIIREVFVNEIFFYSILYPTLCKFQEERSVSEPFNLIPKYIFSIDEPYKEIIVFEDITFNGFVLREKDLLFDDEHASFIFSTYGRFHAISFALKDQNPEEYSKLIAKTNDIYKLFMEKPGLGIALKQAVDLVIEGLSPTDDVALLEKFQRYSSECCDIFLESINSENEKYTGILHGDCWSNNMMFKYEDQNNYKGLKTLNLLDFQLFKIGSPVYDLSYFFYSGGSKKLFDKMDYYFDVYYKSFSAFCRELGSDPEELLPRHILNDHWKKYAKFGMLMSLMLAKIKLIKKDELVQFLNRDSNDSAINWKFSFDQELFKERARDILMSMYEMDAL